MAERPSLPLEIQAAIERDVENIRLVAYTAYDLVFQSVLSRSLAQLENSPLSRVQRPANLKLQLQSTPLLCLTPRRDTTPDTRAVTTRCAPSKRDILTPMKEFKIKRGKYNLAGRDTD